MRARACGLGVDRVLERRGHAQQRDAACAGERAPATRGGEGHAEALGQDPRGEVVQVPPAARDLADEGALEGGRHPNEDAAPLRSASSQTASTIARLRYPRSRQLLAHVEDALQDGEPRRRRQDGHRVGKRPERREGEPDRDDDDPLGATAESDVAPQTHHLGACAGVADEERPPDRGEGERDSPLASVAHEDEPDRPEHEALADPVDGRVEERAERRALAARRASAPSRMSSTSRPRRGRRRARKSHPAQVLEQTAPRPRCRARRPRR